MRITKLILLLACSIRMVYSGVLDAIRGVAVTAVLKKQYEDEWEAHAPQDLLDYNNEIEERKKESSSNS